MTLELVPIEILKEIAEYLAPKQCRSFGLTCRRTLCLLSDDNIWKKYYQNELNIAVVHSRQTYYSQYYNLCKIKLVEITSDICVFIYPDKGDHNKFRIHGAVTRQGIKYCHACQIELHYSPQINDYNKVKPFTLASNKYSTIPTYLVFNNLVCCICEDHEIKFIGTLTKNNYVNSHADIWNNSLADLIYHMDEIIYYYK